MHQPTHSAWSWQVREHTMQHHLFIKNSKLGKVLAAWRRKEKKINTQFYVSTWYDLAYVMRHGNATVFGQI